MSAGKLDSGKPDEQTRLHPVQPQYRPCVLPGRFFESWGRGIEKICSACEKDGVPQPEYMINPGDIMVQFTAPEDRVIRFVTSRVTEKIPSISRHEMQLQRQKA